MKRTKGKKEKGRKTKPKGIKKGNPEVYISFILYSSPALRSVVYVVLTPNPTELVDLAERCILRVYKSCRRCSCCMTLLLLKFAVVAGLKVLVCTY